MNAPGVDDKRYPAIDAKPSVLIVLPTRVTKSFCCVGVKVCQLSLNRPTTMSAMRLLTVNQKAACAIQAAWCRSIELER
jgi:hypothetical protein